MIADATPARTFTCTPVAREADGLPPASYLHEAFDYDPASGLFLWKARPREHFSSDRGHLITNCRFAGRRALNNPHSEGYLIGRLSGIHCFAHRVAWKMVHGVAPEQIDHLNGIRVDNRLANLRACDQALNNRNMAKRSDNKTGHVGVYDEGTRWVAKINRRNIGSFKTKAEAVAARKREEARLGFTRRHGT